MPTTRSATEAPSCPGETRAVYPAVTLALVTLACALFYNGNALYLYEIAGVAAVVSAALAIYANSGSRVELGGPALVALAFFGWSALSVFWSQVPYVSAVELGSMAAGVCLFLVWRSCNRERPIIPTARLLVALGAILAAAMLAQQLTGFEPGAMFVNRNSAAALVNVAWPFAAAGWLHGTGATRRHTLLLAASAMMILAVGLTGSRGALLAGSMALVVLVGIGLFWLQRPRKSLALIVVAALAVIMANGLTGDLIASDTRDLGSPAEAGASRFLIWEAAWEMIQERPWLGWGPGVFFLAYPMFRLPADGSAGYFVHNDYLEFWLERGLPGLALALALAVVTTWTFARFLKELRGRDRATEKRAAMTVATFSALITLAVHGLFSYNFQLMPFLIVFGIVLAEFDRTASRTPQVFFRLPYIRGRPLAMISLAGLTLIPVWAYSAHAIYFHHIDQGLEEFSAQEFAEAIDSFSRARGIWAAPDAAWYLQADTHLTALRQHSFPNGVRQDLVQQAIELLDGAEARNPLRASTPLILGLLRSDHPDLTSGSAAAALRRALELNPRSVEARYALSQVLERGDKLEEAHALIETGLRTRHPAGADMGPLIERYRALTKRLETSSAPNMDPASTGVDKHRIRDGRTRRGTTAD